MDLLSEKQVELLELQLAVEVYELNMDQANEYMDNLYNKLGAYRKNRDNKSEEDNLKGVNELIKSYKKFINFIGKDRFIFYDNGSINYI